MLTHRMSETLDFIRKYIAEHGQSPTVYEIADWLNLASTSGVQRLIGQLQERGFVRRIPKATRGIEIVENKSSAFFVWSDESKALVPWGRREERAQ